MILFLAAGAAFFPVFQAAAQTVKMVKDINTGYEAVPSGMIGLDGSLLFSSLDPESGNDLWISSGTPEGTHLLKDIFPGYGSSSPSEFTRAASTIFFTADDGVHGRELWKTDGTTSGTVLVRDILPGPASSKLFDLVRVGPALCFFTGDYETGYELWRSDGTSSGTDRVLDLRAATSQGERGYVSPTLISSGSDLFFFSTISYPPVQNILWMSDGTTSGTRPFREVLPDPSLIPGKLFALLGDYVFFQATDPVNGTGVWAWERSTNTVRLIKAFYNSGTFHITSLRALGGVVYFTVSTPLNGGQLWRSDGTSGGLFLLLQSSALLDPGEFVQAGSRLFFVAGATGNFPELWTTDGTPGGTLRLKAFAPLLIPAHPHLLTAVGSRLYFAATGLNEDEVWESDGTEAGTRPVTDFPTDEASSVRGLAAVGALRLYFTRTSQVYVSELWTLDVASTSPIRVRVYSNTRASSNPMFFSAFNGMVYFSAITEGQVWRSDGTDQGTWMLKQFNSNIGPWDYLPNKYSGNGVDLYFAASAGGTGKELWKTDGTSTGTVLIKDINPGAASSNPGSLCRIGRFVYFNATGSDGGTDIWRTDGTEAGTVRLKDVIPSPGLQSAYLLSAGENLLYFSSKREVNGVWELGLWRTDGTLAGTWQVASDTGNNPVHNIWGLTTLGNVAFFNGKNDASGAELWESDGTPDGAFMVKDIAYKTYSSDPQDLTPMGDRLYFSADDLISGRELWVTDGTSTGTHRVKDVLSGPYSSNPQSLTVAGNTLYFVAQDREGNWQLWKSDGTEEGTVFLKSFGVQLFPQNWVLWSMTPFRDCVFFAMTDPEHGIEPWMSDGTPEGTGMIKDVLPGTGSSYPYMFAATSNAVLFPADDGIHGNELWGFFWNVPDVHSRGWYFH